VLCVAADDNPTTPTTTQPNSDLAITFTTTSTTTTTTDNKPSAGSPKLSSPPGTQINGNVKPPSPGSPNNNKHVEELYDIPVGEYAGSKDVCTVMLSSLAEHDISFLSLFIKCSSSYVLLQLQNYAWLKLHCVGATFKKYLRSYELVLVLLLLLIVVVLLLLLVYDVSIFDYSILE
jgi:hypothetical protein